MDNQEFKNLLKVVNNKSTIITSDFIKYIKSLYNRCFKFQVSEGELYIKFTTGAASSLDELIYLPADSFFVVNSKLVQATKNGLLCIKDIIVIGNIIELTPEDYEKAYYQAIKVSDIQGRVLSKTEYENLISKFSLTNRSLSSTELESYLQRLIGKYIRFIYDDCSELWIHHNSLNYRFEGNKIAVECDRMLISTVEEDSRFCPKEYYPINKLNTSGVFTEVTKRDYQEKFNEVFK